MATEISRDLSGVGSGQEDPNGGKRAGSPYRDMVPPGTSRRPESLTLSKSDLAPWDRVKMARHPDRPHTLDYIQRLCTDFVEMHGDRLFGDDAAIIGGLALFDGQPVMVI